MCGLIGFSQNKYAAKDGHFSYLMAKILLSDSSVRGEHSTGISFTSMNDSFIRTLKDAISPKVFINTEGFHSSFVDHSPPTLIGHTRFATMGLKNKENAHPFVFPGVKDGKSTVAGTHNGWLLDEDRVTDKSTSYQQFCRDHKYEIPEVDSSIIFKHIFETQDVTSVKDIEGAMALAFVFEGSLYLYRRKSKPLFYIQVTWGKSHLLAYSSRVEGLTDVFGVGLKDQVKPVPEDVMLVIQNGKIVKEISIEKPSVDIGLDESPTYYYSSNAPAYTGYHHNNHLNQSWNRHHNTDLFNETDSRLSVRVDAVKKINALVLQNKVNIPILQACGYNVLNHPLFQSSVLSGLGYKQINLPKSQVRHILKRDKDINNATDSMVLILSLNGVNKGNKTISFEGWKLCLSEDDNIGGVKPYYRMHVFSSKNKAGLVVPKHFGKNGKVELTLHPKDGLIQDSKGQEFHPMLFYKFTVDFYEKQVSEVACNIPFFQSFEDYDSEVTEERGRKLTINGYEGEVFFIRKAKFKCCSISNFPHIVSFHKTKHNDSSQDTEHNQGEQGSAEGLPFIDDLNDFPKFESTELSDVKQKAKSNFLNMKKDLDEAMVRVADNFDHAKTLYFDTDKVSFSRKVYLSWSNLIATANVFQKNGYFVDYAGLMRSFKKTIMLYGKSDVLDVPNNPTTGYWYDNAFQPLDPKVAIKIMNESGTTEEKEELLSLIEDMTQDAVMQIDSFTQRVESHLK